MGQPAEARPEQIRQALERILASREFARSERSRAFLTFLVEEHIAGRTGRLKGTKIAEEVFGRDDSFDAATDTIVRVQAAALRRSSSAPSDR